MTQTNNEEWRKVVGYEDRYQVSESGKIYSLLRNRVLKPSFSNGYQSINFYRSKAKNKTCYIHALVAEAFLGKRPNNCEINHKDGVKTNNHFSNLEYCTGEENITHAISTGLWNNKGERNGRSVLTEADVRNIRDLLDKGSKGCDLAKKYNVSPSTISGIKRRVYWA